MLQRGHDEAVGHEAGQAFEVEGGRGALCVWDQVLFRPGDFAVEVVDVDGEAVGFGVRAAGLACGVLPDRG